MNKAKQQYEVVKDLLDHVEAKMRINSDKLAITHYQIIKIRLLDELADLLNDPVIARAWDDKENL